MKKSISYFGRLSLAQKENLTWKLMLLPTVLILFVVTIFPTIFSFYNSLLQWNFASPQLGKKFVGPGNYIKALTDVNFLNALFNTLLIVLIAVAIEFMIGFIVALLFNENLKGFKAARTLMIVPTMITPVVASLMWLLMYNTDYGIIRFFAECVGISPAPAWLADKRTALMSVIAVDVWQWTPFVMLILLAALTALPRDVIEASHVDGSNGLQRFIFIILPSMKPAITIVLLMRIMDTFKFFEVVYMLTKGGPGNITETVSYYAYKVGFSFFEVGYSSAVSIVILIVIVTISQMLNKYISDEWEI